MRLKVLLPFRVFANEPNVSRIVAETHEGSFGLLPKRRDCIASLVPGILTYESDTAGEVFVAVDEGLLVKIGADVVVSVRRAARGTDLARLRDAVQREYLTLDALALAERAATEKLESGFVGRFARFHDQ